MTPTTFVETERGGGWLFLIREPTWRGNPYDTVALRVEQLWAWRCSFCWRALFLGRKTGAVNVAVGGRSYGVQSWIGDCLRWTEWTCVWRERRLDRGPRSGSHDLAWRFTVEDGFPRCPPPGVSLLKFDSVAPTWCYTEAPVFDGGSRKKCLRVGVSWTWSCGLLMKALHVFWNCISKRN